MVLLVVVLARIPAGLRWDDLCKASKHADIGPLAAWGRAPSNPPQWSPELTAGGTRGCAELAAAAKDPQWSPALNAGGTRG